MSRFLTHLDPGMPVPFGGNRIATVSPELAAAFKEGDRLVVVQTSGDLLHIPLEDWHSAETAIDAATGAFAAMGGVSDDQITAFFHGFASRLEDQETFSPIAEANADDVVRALERGRSTTRLVFSEAMRREMIEGLRLWGDSGSGRGEVIETITHRGWKLEQTRSGLGVIGFVFEGRPNVVADATGVLRGGNTVVLRIGSDALGTARSILENALEPALVEAGVPAGAVSLVDAMSRAAGWAMFSDSRLGLAVARGSGAAVSQLGAVARQSGTPVSLHGTGGAWIIAGESASAEALASAVYQSLDRKVCNTVNTVCIVESRAHDLVPVFLEALDRAGQRREAASKLHVTAETKRLIPPDWFVKVPIMRAGGRTSESRTEVISGEQLGLEWEWEDSPEVTLAVVGDVEEAIRLFNEQSPKFIASLVSNDDKEHQRFFDGIDAPFVGNGFTRWVDGQYALNTPELGLSNWQFGRLFGRGGILSGSSAFTVRSRVTQTDTGIGR